MKYLNEFEKWISYEKLDKELKDELERIKGNDSEIKERFEKILQFGTAGLRGIIGAGTNRMNRFVVGAATQGLSNVIIELGQKAMERGVVIAYDSRINSELFARETASVLAANGIKAFLFDSLRPVPELSFALRYLNAKAGIAITASHNPYIYNGYKVYWEDGSQISGDLASKIFEAIKKIDMFTQVKRAELDNNNKIIIIGKEIDEKYYEEVLKLSINSEVIKNCDLKIVYTPLHGTGNVPVRNVLKKAGYKDVVIVKEQENPDSLFKTVKSPNPEDKECLEIAIQYAKKENADLIIGTDPDCDRVGIAAPSGNGEYDTLTGNQIGILLCEYILSSLKEQGRLPENGAVVKSIVSTNMVDAICDYYGVRLFNVLTGFKYIGEKIKEFEESGEYKFLFGFEESYGYLSGTHARDKDGVNASMLIAEMTAYHKQNKNTLFDALNNLYNKYGFYSEKTISLTFEGLNGMEKIKSLMSDLRNNPVSEINNIKVAELIDFNNGYMGLPSSDVLNIKLVDGTDIFIRPSGTEPKIKGYILTKDDSLKNSLSKTINLEKALKDILK